jgi:ketosteroid isomerase-like protein
MTMTVPELAERFFAAASTFDTEALDRLLAPDAGRWVNITGQRESRQEFLSFVELEGSLLRDTTFHVDGRTFADDGFVLQLTVEGTTIGGNALRVPACLVVAVEDGLIAGIHEYADSAQAKPILKEIIAAQRTAGP